MNAQELFGANTPDEHSITAHAVYDSECEWLDYNGYCEPMSTDAILALLARDGIEWGKYPNHQAGTVWISKVSDQIRLPDQPPATIAHALRCLWLAAKGEAK